MIYLLIWRNIWRNKRRTLITMASVAFTVFLAVTMKSMQTGVFENLIRNMVSYYSGYLQVHKSGYWDEKVLDNCFNSADSDLIQAVKYQGIKQIIPRLETFILISNGDQTKGCMVAGIDPPIEESLTHFSKKLISGNFWKEENNEIVLASRLAEKLNANVGDTVFLLGQGYRESFVAGKFKVSGIIHFGSPELNASIAFLPLGVAREMLNTGQNITAYILDLEDPEKMEILQNDLKERIPSDYEVLSWKEMMPEISDHMKADGMGYYVMMGILYLIIVFGTFGTIFMITAERKYEFSMLLAIGMKKRMLTFILFGEILLLAFGGAILGMCLSIPIVLYLQEFPIRLGGEFGKAFEQYGFEPVWPALFEWNVIFEQSLIVLILSVIIGLYPVWHVFRFKEIGKIRL